MQVVMSKEEYDGLTNGIDKLSEIKRAVRKNYKDVDEFDFTILGCTVQLRNIIRILDVLTDEQLSKIPEEIKIEL